MKKNQQKLGLSKLSSKVAKLPQNKNVNKKSNVWKFSDKELGQKN